MQRWLEALAITLLSIGLFGSACSTEIAPSVTVERRFSGTVNAAGATVPFDMSLFLRKLASGHNAVTGGFTAGQVQGTVSGTLDGTFESGTFRGSLSVATAPTATTLSSVVSEEIWNPSGQLTPSLNQEADTSCVVEQEYTGLLSVSRLSWTPGSVIHSCPTNPLGFTIDVGTSAQPPTTSVPTTSSTSTTSVSTTTSTSTTTTVAPTTTSVPSTTTSLTTTVAPTTTSVPSTTTTSPTTSTTTTVGPTTSTTTSSSTTSTTPTTSTSTTTSTVPGPTDCHFGLNPSLASFTAAGGSGKFAVAVVIGCTWRVTSAQGPWVTVTSPTVGQVVTGNGAVVFSVAANTTFSPRTGQIFMANAINPDNVASFRISQEGIIIPTRDR
jgi:hypothetical protein